MKPLFVVVFLAVYFLRYTTSLHFMRRDDISVRYYFPKLFSIIAGNSAAAQHRWSQTKGTLWNYLYVVCNLVCNISEKCFCCISLSSIIYKFSVQCDSSPSSFVITPSILQMTVVCWWHWEEFASEVDVSIVYSKSQISLCSPSVRIHSPVTDHCLYVDLSSCIIGSGCC